VTELTDILSAYTPISLQEMDSVKLMNRIDTKYVVSLDLLPTLLETARDDYYVQEIEGKRIALYDTMYYDTSTLDMYIRHHDKQLVRQKIRVRQYVDSGFTFLEIKRKNNKGRTKKKRIAVPGFRINGNTIGKGKEDITVEEFISQKSRYTWDSISPHLRTDFNRVTLVNKEKTERLTIDLNLVWDNIITGETMTYPNLVIIELKRAGHIYSPMAQILRDNHIHPFKVSKYCIGTALTTPNLKRNRFKSKIHTIEKILDL